MVVTGFVLGFCHLWLLRCQKSLYNSSVNKQFRLILYSWQSGVEACMQVTRPFWCIYFRVSANRMKCHKLQIGVYLILYKIDGDNRCTFNSTLRFVNWIKPTSPDADWFWEKQNRTQIQRGYMIRLIKRSSAINLVKERPTQLNWIEVNIRASEWRFFLDICGYLDNFSCYESIPWRLWWQKHQVAKKSSGTIVNAKSSVYLTACSQYPSFISDKWLTTNGNNLNMFRLYDCNTRILVFHCQPINLYFCAQCCVLLLLLLLMLVVVVVMCYSTTTSRFLDLFSTRVVPFILIVHRYPFLNRRTIQWLVSQSIANMSVQFIQD